MDEKLKSDQKIIEELVKTLTIDDYVKKFNYGRYVFEKKLGAKSSSANIVLDTKNNNKRFKI